MSVLPEKVAGWLREMFGKFTTTPLSGGMICQAAKLMTTEGLFVVKWKQNAPLHFFRMEDKGLERLREAGALRVPDVKGRCDEKPDSNRSSWLVMEYVESRPPSDVVAFARRLGEGLALMHHEALSPYGGFGLYADNYLGSLLQKNTLHDRWPDFYRDCRLLPQIEIAREKRLLPSERERLLMRLVERLDTLLDDLDSRPALLHGDLWSGNLLSASDEPVLIDPAVYYGEREMEIAYMQLFNGFSPTVFEAYNAVYPLDPGYERRRPLHQLYPLLVHLNHFGETYGPDVEHVCRHYIS